MGSRHRRCTWRGGGAGSGRERRRAEEEGESKKRGGGKADICRNMMARGRGGGRDKEEGGDVK